MDDLPTPDRTGEAARFSGSGLAVCLVLALLGLGGGLFIAFFGFNSSEGQTRITGVAPEIIYAPPTPTASPALELEPVSSLEESTLPSPVSPPLQLHLRATAPLTASLPSDAPEAFSALSPARLSQSEDRVASASVTFGITGRPAILANSYQAFSATPASSSPGHFEALKTAVIPEPSGAILFTVSAAALASFRFVRGRKR